MESLAKRTCRPEGRLFHLEDIPTTENVWWPSSSRLWNRHTLNICYRLLGSFLHDDGLWKSRMIECLVVGHSVWMDRLPWWRGCPGCQVEASTWVVIHVGLLYGFRQHRKRSFLRPQKFSNRPNLLRLSLVMSNVQNSRPGSMYTSSFLDCDGHTTYVQYMQTGAGWCSRLFTLLLFFQSLVAFAKVKRQILLCDPEIKTLKDFTNNTMFWVNQEFCMMWVGSLSLLMLTVIFQLLWSVVAQW